MKLTRNLQILLDNYKSTLSEEHYLSFKRHVEKIMLNVLEELGGIPAGANRGRRVHELMDIEIQKAAEIKTSCKAGCGACCHFEVEITADDADILAEAVKSGRLEVDRQRLSLLASRERHDTAWTKGVVRENRCLFLSEGNSCRAYLDRPSACRKLLVTSPSSDCGDPAGFPQPLLIPVAEIILSAALNVPDNHYAAMARMLEPRVARIETSEVPVVPAQDEIDFTQVQG